MKIFSKQILLLIVFFGLSNYSCRQFLDVDPPKDKIVPYQIFENNDIATSAITGIYSKMITSGFASGQASSLTVINGLSSDELRSHGPTYDEFYKNEIQVSNSTINTFWNQAYNFIYATNAILEGLKNPGGVTENVRKQLEGEAKFIRAFCYFYLVNEFGNVSLNLTTDYRVTEKSFQNSKEEVYSQIILDLKEAEILLSDTYISTERVRPNRWAAKALLARVYLYRERWAEAELKATEVVNQKNLYNLVSDLDKVFLKNSTETIWQLMPTNTSGVNTAEGNVFILTATPLVVSLPPSFITLFESADLRKTKWIGQYTNSTGQYFYPYKYKIKNTSTSITEYSMVIRLAEVYLIRAEALAKQSKLSSSLEDINLIRSRANLTTPLTGLEQSECLLEIEYQRRLELFTEWGHRWLDLKRTGKASNILEPLKGVTWQQTDVFYPIPQVELDRNGNIVQNNGY